MRSYSGGLLAILVLTAILLSTMAAGPSVPPPAVEEHGALPAMTTHLALSTRYKPIGNSNNALVHDLLRQQGKARHKIHGDGSCMYYAISQQLYCRYDIRQTAQQLRQMAADQLNANACGGVVDIFFVGDVRDAAKKAIAKSEYGDQLQMGAIAQRLKLQVHVYQVLSNGSDHKLEVYVEGPEDAPHKIEVYLTWMGEHSPANHYDSVVDAGWDNCTLCQGDGQPCKGYCNNSGSITVARRCQLPTS